MKNPDQYYRDNKWLVRVIKRGQDIDTAKIVKCKGFPDEVVLARAVWPDQAQRVCDEHNDALCKVLFRQDEPERERSATNLRS